MKTLPLPLEIFNNVFLFCLPDKREALHPNSAPLVLMRVCTEWRTVALSMPQLWTSLCLPRHMPDGPVQFQSFLSALEGWLLRSEFLPLDIVLSTEVTREDMLAEILAILCFHSCRWRSFYLWLDHPVAVPHALASLTGCLPLLESCTFRDLTNSNGHVMLGALLTAPRLQDLSVGWFGSVQDWELPWPHLTSFAWGLDVGYCPLRDMISGISQCRNLLRSQEVPHLLQLFLSVCIQQHLDVFLRSFILPRLQNLELDVSPDHKEEQYTLLPTTLLRFSSHCSSSLQILQLTNIHMEGVALLEVLRNVPNLTFLGLSCAVFNARVVDALTLRFGADQVLISGQNTKLLTFQIALEDNPKFIPICGPFDAPFYNMLIDMVESRWFLPTNARDTNSDGILKLERFILSHEDMLRMKVEAPEAWARFEGIHSLM
ncbi:hypothetical protein EW146_g46 [Bondarzewia mesenterica]|uniref:Uncharacterized protein n=1 Tax=Bondarzewia mesenterica TaxID=1095465 RepID=A0A4V3XGJ2_9AGAM|nr:hypothetical protein EW146_g46 [Bondarzewia mesenterica]